VPANISNPQEMFLHDLREMLYVERQLADQVLPEIGKEVKGRELRNGIDAHRKQSKQHASNLERAFDILGTQAKTEPSHALNGLKRDHDQLSSNIQMEQLRDLFDAEAMAKSEHLEIAAYRGLIMMAQQMGQSEIQQLLEENCRQDEEQLQRLEQMCQKMGQQIGQAA
jgi:ferritin-like metal-binding protein YciE